MGSTTEKAEYGGLLSVNLTMRTFMFLCLIKFALARPQDDYFYQQQQNNAAFDNQYTADQLQMLQQYDLEQQQQQLAEQHFPEQQQFQYYPENQQTQLQGHQLQQQQQKQEQQQFQQLVEQQQVQQFPQQQQLQFYPEIQQLQLQENQLLQQEQQFDQQEMIQQQFQQQVEQQQLQQQQQEQQEQQQQKHVLNFEKSSDPQLVSEYANQLVRQAQQLIQYEQQELQEQQQKQQQKQPITENTSSIDQSNETYASAEQTQNQVNEQLEVTQSQQHLQPQYNHQEQQHSIQFNSIFQPQITQRLEIQQVPQDLSTPQTTVAIPQQYQTTTQLPQTNGAQTVTYNKEFFYLAAPDDENDDVSENEESEITQIRKNIRVVFIKAPEQNVIEKAALKLAKQSIETQTNIYVLTKQHGVGELVKKLEEVRQTTHHAKPEVIFVKYKTPEEAEQAQRAIQAQYEALDGTNNYGTEYASPNQSTVSSSVTATSNFSDQVSPEDAYE